MERNEIIYTKTDEAPALATESLLPIFSSFTKKADIKISLKNISLSNRILAATSDYLSKEQKVSDDLEFLAKLCLNPEANIIKLPNISASVSQLKAAILELQKKGYAIPDYPENPRNITEENVKKMYSLVLGSAVNPVIREGNSDRRAAKSVKNYAKRNPHKMDAWDKNSKTKVVSMSYGDFFASEKSMTNANKETAIGFVFENDTNKSQKYLRENLKLLPFEVLDCSVMSAKSLENFVRDCINAAKNENLLFSFHLKATMMKISDPIIFGTIFKTFFERVFDKYRDIFENLGVCADLGLSDLLSKIKGNRFEEQIVADINSRFDEISVAMVDSGKNISNFSVPSDIIIDASMPAMIKTGGKMYDKTGKLCDVLAIIPDRSYSAVYEAIVEFCKKNGAFDPQKLGGVSNVGLMAKQAEEYGSHDKTFKIENDGTVKIIDENGNVFIEQKVQKGDIFRACQTKHDVVVNWVKLVVERAKTTRVPAIFWLDAYRSHDRELIRKIVEEIKTYNISGLNIRIMSPKDACIYSVERMTAGLDTISATGNVLRDYLTDLFPIIELGTSAKMLSIVPLMGGGGLFETGAGGSAPKHVQQFIEQNFLRWDSLGEFMAFVPSLEKYAHVHRNEKAKILAETLDEAVEKILENQKSPNREPISLDNRGSHFYLALYWARALANQEKDVELAKVFAEIAQKLSQNEKEICSDLLSVQNNPVDLGGYYFCDHEKIKNAMRPSKIFNEIIDNF
ncbi:MAG: NADP-dependent isocitrate dehydrogenase [Chitinispirillales bacterium]|jgi:isocitrate dehydrogenase|nr:NADP-dependent isocitrate dehydrogenase [Chitinispirillales bacterium]